MAYYIDLFSPETYEAFSKSDKSTSGFRFRQRNTAAGVKPGDKLIGYVTRLSRWVGILEVTDPYFIDDKPIFTANADPFVIRFKVKPTIWLPLEKGIPIDDKICWDNLSFTKKLHPGSLAWTGMVRGSLRKLDDKDGQYLEKILLKQNSKPKIYPLSESAIKKLKAPTVKTQDSKQVTVSIPKNDENDSPSSTQEKNSQRESIKIQAKLAEIGEKMNLKIWIPKNDRQKVQELWKPETKCLLDQLPMNYEDVTMETIENIDVLWIKGRMILRAFEVEHTTSIYSGILRMADLMALQPNLDISAHIVAPVERKKKVFKELTRPVFTLLEKGPLSESCTYISYESINKLAEEKNLSHMIPSVLEEYEEYAEDADI